MNILKNGSVPITHEGWGVGWGIASYVCYTVPEIWHVIVFILGYFFCPFTSLIARKIKIKKKRKKSLEISSFYNSIPKIIIICYTVPEIWCVTYVIIFHFGPFFALLPQWKKCLKISFYKSVPKIMIIFHTVPEIWHMTGVIVIFFILAYFLPFYPLTVWKLKLKK